VLVDHINNLRRQGMPREQAVLEGARDRLRPILMTVVTTILGLLPLAISTTKIGGVMAFCPGMPWGGGYPQDRIIGGLIEELTERLSAMDPPAAEKRPCTLENFGPEIVYDHDIATLTMFEMLEEAGVRVRLGTMALEPEMAGGRIASVACCDRNGPFTLEAGIVIDCSGDGDISAKAGVPYALAMPRAT